MATKSTINVSEEATTFSEYRTGLKRDKPDPRDLTRVYGAPDIPSTDSHPVVDLRKYVHNVYDQGKINSCTANVVCAAYELELKRQAEPNNFYYYHFDFSRLFLYYNSRVCENMTGVDGGAGIRDTLKAIHSVGICRESLWPYSTWNITKKPPPACYDDAHGKTITKYEHLQQDIHQFRASLKQGFPFVFGFNQYKSFDKISKNGLMPMPTYYEIVSTPEPDKHAVLAVGYDDNTKCITVLNSWGKSWGDKGYFYMPYDYITNPSKAFDFWKIESASENIEVVVYNPDDIEVVIHQT